MTTPNPLPSDDPTRQMSNVLVAARHPADATPMSAPGWSSNHSVGGGDVAAGLIVNHLPDPVGWQRLAIPAAVTALRAGGRGQIHAACGTGKTVTAAHIAAQLCPPGGYVVIACPSVALVAQTLAVLGHSNGTALAVCGDDTVADTAAHTSDLPDAVTVTTDPATIAGWLRAPSRSARLIVTTHRSAGLLGGALIATGIAADVLVVDEAHHSAGPDDKLTALLHHDQGLPAVRRLYLSATPRTGDLDDEHLLSMDDTEVFGPVLHRYTFAQAIADGWLDDYRIAVVGVSRAEILPLVRDLTGTRDAGRGADGPLRTAMVATALARAAAEFDLRRTIVYTHRVADSRAFAAALPVTLAALSEPTRPNMALTCHHVDGRHSTAARRAFLSDLADPPDNGWAVLSNVRCLGEGIDVPAVDSVVFSHPKTSTVDVVQAVGRGLRRNPTGSGVATVLVPVLVGDDAAVDAQADADGYSTIWQVVRALRAHDESLAIALNRQRQYLDVTPVLPEQVVVRLPDGYDIDQYLQHLTVRLITATTSPWWEGYGAAVRYHATHGHLYPRVDHVTDDGYPLGRWIHHQRKARRTKTIAAERVQALDTLGMLWDPRSTNWETGLQHAAAYRAQHGHLRVPPDHTTIHGYPLGSWVRTQRRAHRSGRLDPDRSAALEHLGIEFDPYQAMWERGITHAIAFHARQGHLNVPQHHTEADGYRLGQFIVAQRMLRKRGTLTAERITALNALNMMWDIRTHSFAVGLAHAHEYHHRYGTLRMPKSAETRDGYRLGNWVKEQRRRLRAGKLTADRIAQLDAISTTWRS
ncbi:DEAD/DEAH box helicase [Micromonospora sp. WMMD710]|uniref:DEAD/DEAH box helicase n=1 Tax=Micromonospora sp. WMMD710 TaxID=3016085 RepID=UPI002416207A|nr:DEAD/DEAH box helicase [Micromonospora sp. WMMD710]MDG4760356.1 Helicase associated domain protein [Micromonospora sp. WMMD710]